MYKLITHLKNRLLGISARSVAIGIGVLLSLPFVVSAASVVRAQEQEWQRKREFSQQLQAMRSRSDAHQFAATSFEKCADAFTNRVVCAASIRILANTHGNHFAEKVDRALSDIGLIE